jgi:hypothetical protein
VEYLLRWNNRLPDFLKKETPRASMVIHSLGFVMSATNISSATQISPISDTQVRIGWGTVACEHQALYYRELFSSVNIIQEQVILSTTKFYFLFLLDKAV